MYMDTHYIVDICDIEFSYRVVFPEFLSSTKSKAEDAIRFYGNIADMYNKKKI